LVGFFFQAEDGIRAFHVTGVQTCALPISPDCTRFCASAGARARLSSRPASREKDVRRMAGSPLWNGRLSSRCVPPLSSGVAGERPGGGGVIFWVLLPTEGREAHGRPGRIVVLEATKRGRPWPKWIVCPSWVAGRVIAYGIGVRRIGAASPGRCW